MIKKYEKSWKIIKTGKIFGLYNYSSLYITWKCLKTFKVLFFRLILTLYFIYIRKNISYRSVYSEWIKSINPKDYISLSLYLT